MIQKIADYINRLIKNVTISAYAHNKRSWLINHYLNKNGTLKPDLIIGHNLGALYPCWKYSKIWGVPFAFDIEDYHPGEGVTNEGSTIESHRRQYLLKNILPNAKYVSFASPLIMQKTLELCGKENIQNPTLINNCFPQDEFELPSSFQLPASNSKLKFVWFSQNINHSRGLEFTIEALKPFAKQIHLNLIGQSHQHFHQQWIQPNQHFITIVEPLPLKELFNTLSDCDLGLAIEPGKDLNNNLALSNKIWAYFQSGLYIIATNTPAQNRFLQDHSSHGVVIEPRIQSMQHTLENILQNKDTILSEKTTRYIRAKDFSWEFEANRLLELWH